MLSPDAVIAPQIQWDCGCRYLDFDPPNKILRIANHCVEIGWDSSPETDTRFTSSALRAQPRKVRVFRKPDGVRQSDQYLVVPVGEGLGPKHCVAKPAGVCCTT